MQYFRAMKDFELSFHHVIPGTYNFCLAVAHSFKIPGDEHYWDWKLFLQGQILACKFYCDMSGN